MTTVLYADVLFIVNFSMDFISLCLTAKILSLRRSLIRYIASAALGASAATTMTALSVEGLPEALSTIALSVAMTFVAYGFGSPKLLLERSLALWGAGALIGGAVTALCSIGERAPLVNAVGGRERPWGFIAVGVLLVWGFVRLICPRLGRKSARVTLCFDGRAVTGEALVDSGNLVSDPISGDAVIFLSRPLAERLLGEREASLLCETRIDELSPPLRSRVRVIPTSGALGGGVCSAFVPDSVEVLPDRASRRAIAAVVDVPEDHFAGFAMLLPSVLG